jgi:predicted DsbA family dithiol-disulfide isomerase
MTVENPRITVRYYSDLLCIWAYLAQIKLDQLRRDYPDRVRLEYGYVPVFGSVARKIGQGWSDRGGLAGYGAHIREVAQQFGHVEVHPDVWTRLAPKSSLGPHLFLKAAAVVGVTGGISPDPVVEFDGRSRLEELGWRLRLAFFRDLRDIARHDVQFAILDELQLPAGPIQEKLEDGSAQAALAEDHETAVALQITGSPTFLLNENRQKLYGNVGYRIIEANVQELLRNNSNIASWC